MGERKKYTVGGVFWLEFEIDTRKYGNVKFLIRNAEGRQEWLYLGIGKVTEIIDQLTEWSEKFLKESF